VRAFSRMIKGHVKFHVLFQFQPRSFYNNPPNKVMKFALYFFALLALSVCSLAQSKSNDALTNQVRSLRAEKSITVSYDAGGNSSKIMAVTENFSDGEAHSAGLQAMNFAMGFFYPGNELKSSPAEIHLAFWALSKKPRFAEAHGLKVIAGGATADLGDSRYAAKPREDMEYLNFSLSVESLAKLAQPGARIQLGHSQFTITSSQAATIRNFLAVSSF
jgi:hypothetical protein